MSEQYDAYLERHKKNVKKSFNWLKRSLPEVIPDDLLDTISFNIDFHDDTKTIPDEYDAYDAYFYGKKRTKAIENNFKMAWLAHIHRSPHHWQHWMLLNDDGSVNRLDMPYECIIEMICDWWSFSWQDDDVWEIFDWYEHNKKNIKLSKKTRETVEDILDKLEKKLTKVRGPRE